MVCGTDGWQLVMPALIWYDLKDIARGSFQTFFNVDACFLSFGGISFSLC